MCGIADDLLVASPRSIKPAQAVSSTSALAAGWLPTPPTPDLEGYALGPIPETSSSTAWFAVPRDGDPLAMYVSGETEQQDQLLLEWGRRTGQREGFQTVAVNQVRIRAVAERGATIPWRFVPIDARVRGATALRATLVNSGAPGGAVAVTAPVTYSREPFTRRLVIGHALALPNVATFFPCADQPPLHHGIVDVPRTIVTARDAEAPVRYPSTTPFAGLLDLYRVTPLPLRLPEGRPEGLLAFAVDPRIPGSMNAPPDRETTVG